MSTSPDDPTIDTVAPPATGDSSAAGDSRPVRHEPTRKRLRATLGGAVILDTVGAELVWEIPYYPQYYIPLADVVDGALIETTTVSASEQNAPAALGPVRRFSISANDVTSPDGAWQHPQAEPELLRSMVRFDWDALDSWFEEDEEVFVHPRSPYTRVDVLESSRRVRVDIGGVTVAETTRPKLLFETGLPTRYYIPKTDVRLELLTPTELTTSCPYKGTARYWTVVIDGVEHPNVVWGYDAPRRESIGLAGMVCFFNTNVDLVVDGEADDGRHPNERSGE